jgi:hypothetical protein
VADEGGVGRQVFLCHSSGGFIYIYIGDAFAVTTGTSDGQIPTRPGFYLKSCHIAPTKLPSGVWLSGTYATLDLQFASVARIDAAQLWMCMPIMRFIVVHGAAGRRCFDDSSGAPAAPSARLNKTLIQIIFFSLHT